MATAPLLPNNSDNQMHNPHIPRRGRNRAAIWGIILLIAGLSTLASTLNWFVGISGFIFVLLFAAGGLAFGYVFVRDMQQSWWAAIPAGALLGLSGTIMVSEYAPERIAFLGGAVFLGALSLGFWAIYAVRRDMWWAIIPGGVLFSLAVTAALGASSFGAWREDLAGAVFLFGMGLTFLLVALARADDGRSRWWAYIPASILMLLGVLIAFSATAWLESFNVIAAVAMVAGGGYLLYKAFSSQGDA